MGSHAFLHAATWEGDLYCEDLRNPASETGLKPRSFPMMPRAGNTSDFCGSFVVFSRQHNCFVMSRAVGKELFVFDAQLSNLLLHVVFDDFFRGILLQNSPLFSLFARARIVRSTASTCVPMSPFPRFCPVPIRQQCIASSG